MGVVVWLGLLFTTTSDSHEIELIHKIVFYAILVIVPLALSLVPAGDRRGNFGLYRLVVLVQPVAAIVTIASFFVEKGSLSAALSVAWFILTALIALFGLTRLVARRFYPIEELSIDAGMLYLPVAGAWLVVYRLGVQPFDYGETIILLTVIHFHFAGFAAPIIAGMLGRLLAKTQSQRSKIFPLIVFAHHRCDAADRCGHHVFTVARFDWYVASYSGTGVARGVDSCSRMAGDRFDERALALCNCGAVELCGDGARVSLRLQHRD